MTHVDLTDSTHVFTTTLRQEVKSHCISSGHGKGTTDCYEIAVRDFYPCILCKRSVLRESKTLNDHMHKGCHAIQFCREIHISHQ